MKIRSEELNKSTAYKLLTGVVVPRPIAWVSTRSAAGRSNLAPFSCFTFVSADPPMIGFNCGLRDGVRKDTARNIVETRQFVVNIVDEPLLDQMHLSAADFPPDISEGEVLQVPFMASDLISPLRIASSPISLECDLDQIVSFGRSGSEFFVGEVKIFHVRDGLLTNGKIDTEALRPVARLGGPVYGKIGEVVRMQRAE